VGLLFLITVAVHVKIDFVLPYFGGNPDVPLLAQLLPLFLGGALVQILRNRVPLHWADALGAAVVSASFIVVLNGWGAQLTAPLLTYVILWVASVLPSPRVIQRNDISYGLYIYAFPVQQLLAIAAVFTHGLVLYDLAAFAVTVPLAIVSWVVVERPIMRRARRLGGTGSSATTVTSRAEAPTPLADQSETLREVAV
jgi:peptidoglycan/LPS O-acetylase OafA/YrhL